MASLEKSIEMNVPAHAAYEQLTRYDEYPAFMEGVLEVKQTDPTHLHWRCAHDGVEREHDAEITAQVPDQFLAWRDLTGKPDFGQIKLETPADGQTRLNFRLEYDLQCPAEHATDTEARIAQRIEADLQRFKTLVESRMAGGMQAADLNRAAPDNVTQSWLPRLMDVWEEPLTAMRTMSREMDSMFERFLGRPLGLPQWTHLGATGNWSPAVEVARRDNQLIISADLPGIKRDAVNVEIKDDKLTIEGDWLQQTDGANLEYRRTERIYGHFYRVIPLPEGVDPNAASASMHDGVLEITLPVTPQQRQRRRLDIQSQRGP